MRARLIARTDGLRAVGMFLRHLRPPGPVGPLEDLMVDIMLPSWLTQLVSQWRIIHTRTYWWYSVALTFCGSVPQWYGVLRYCSRRSALMPLRHEAYYEERTYRKACTQCCHRSG